VQMKKIALFPLFFILLACVGSYYANFRTSFYAENLKVDYYWEFGLLKITGSNPFYNGKQFTIDEIVNYVKTDSFCYNFVIPRKEFVGERFFLDESRRLNFECTYFFNDFFESQRKTELFLIGSILHRNADVFDMDSLYRFVYNGDSIELKSPVMSNHSSIQDSVYTHEFYLRKDVPVLSFTVHTNANKFSENLNFLKIDPSLLPLESLKYKALKASEETLK
jgi:hypothetical protein